MLEVLPFDALAAEWLGGERARLTAAGRVPSYADAQIAAVAATRGRILVTRNIRDFENFAGPELENWHQP